MAKASALGLTMLQYCENSKIYRMGFVNNLQEDSKYLQKLHAYYCACQCYDVDFLPFNSANWQHSTCNSGNSTFKLNGNQSLTVSGSLITQQTKTNLYCIRLLLRHNSVWGNFYLVTGQEQQRIKQFLGNALPEIKKRNPNFNKIKMSLI